MKYQHQEKVIPEIAERSKRDIEAVNAFIDDVHGNVIAIKTIRHGQARPYADSVYESLIFCHSPNVMATNAPLVRCITEAEARQLAKIFVHTWIDDPKVFGPQLNYVRPESNPCGLEEYENRPDQEFRSSCWRVCITEPYYD